MDHSNSAGIRRHKLVLSFAAIMAFISPAAGVDVSTYALGAKKQALDSTVETVSAGYYAATTLSAVDTDLAAGNIKPGVTIFGFAGNYTGDADAIAVDIIMGKTAYVNGVKLTGTLTTQSLSAANDTVTAGNYTATTLSAVDTDLAAGNIKSGTGIFGINGSLLPSGGTAGPADVVSGKTFYGSGQSDWTLQTGSLVNFTPGWGADVNGNPTAKSWWPTSLFATSPGNSTTIEAKYYIYPLSKSSPLYNTNTPISYDGVAFQKSLVGGPANGLLYYFPIPSVNQDLTTAKSLQINAASQYVSGSASLLSVLYGTIRKLDAATDYAEELKSGDNSTLAWAGAYEPTPADFAAMTAVSGPYADLHDENTATYHPSTTVSSTHRSEFLHKITLGAFSEDTVRFFARAYQPVSDTHHMSGRLSIWNYNTSAYVLLDRRNDTEGYMISVFDIAKTNTDYVQGGVMYVLVQNEVLGYDHTSTIYFVDFDLWAAYKNPQD